MTLERVERRDVLPEHAHYRDDGCKYSPSCLKCPLPVCVFDMNDLHVYQKDLAGRKRDEQIRKAAEAEGLTYSQLAKRFGVSTRTVHRATSPLTRRPAPIVTTLAVPDVTRKFKLARVTPMPGRYAA